MKNLSVLLLFVALLTSCEGEKPTMTMAQGMVTAEGQVSVTRIGTFADDLAYGGIRGVYIIKDATGQEFIGISGIGISERGTHRSGKASVRDER